VQKIVSWLKSFNEWLAIAAGSLLLGSVLVTLFDIIVRQFWVSLGGTDELSGYAMAISTSWGISYALTCMAHVRIDLLRARRASKGQAMFDIIAVLALASTSIVVAYGAWPVLARAIKYGSAANTTLETPLWIPQSLWMMGWIWFAASALIMAAASLLAFFSGRFERVNSIVGVGGER